MIKLNFFQIKTAFGFIFPAAVFILIFIGACPALSGNQDVWRNEQDAPVIEVLKFKVLKKVSDKFDWNKFAPAVMNLKKGQPLTRAAYLKSLARLQAFAEVESSVFRQGENVRILYHIYPYDRIKNISISGNYPLFEEEVLNAITITVGNIYLSDSLARQEELVAQKYRQEGYINPQVSIDAKQDPKDGHYRLKIFIDKGLYYILSNVKLNGNKKFPDFVLHGKMKAWRSSIALLHNSRFLEKDMREDIRDIIAFYRKKGYADIKINYNIIYDDNSRKAAVDVRINEGPHYQVVFNGNEEVSDRILKKELTIFETGNRGRTGVRRSVQNIRRYYQEQGFIDAKIQQRKTAPSTQKGKKKVYIDIEEGKQYFVKDMRIKNNHFLDIKTLQGQILTKARSTLKKGLYSEQILEEDIESMKALYLRYGFIDVLISKTVNIEESESEPEKKLVTIELSIKEGPQTKIKTITFKGKSPLSKKHLMTLLKMKPGQPLQPFMIETNENEISAQIAPLGYPYVKVSTQTSFSNNQKAVDLVYVINAGPKVTMGDVFIVGNLRTKRKTIEREFDVKPGSDFALASVLESERNLRDFDVFESVRVRPIGLKERSDKVHLLVETYEIKPYFFEFGGGYETYEGPYLRSQIGDHNFLGRNIDLSTGGKVSATGYRWDAEMTLSRLFQKHIETSIGLFSERDEPFNQTFGTKESGGTLTFIKDWDEQLTSQLGWQLKSRQQFSRVDEQSSDEELEEQERRIILVTKPSIIYDTRDSFIQPKKGSLSNFSVEISYGLKNSLDNFLKYLIDLRGFHALNETVTLAGRVGGGVIQPYGIDGDIPDDQLLFLGGTANVRGFGEGLLRYNDDGEPVGGRLSLYGSAETRIGLPYNFEVTFFTDCGSIQMVEENISGGDDVQWAAGLGLRYITPIGPLGLMYGHKLNQREGESQGQYHFSIGYTF
ncbi:MAG: outer membrane protein assembly factor BamA [Desulfobacteraceae bacterium]|nr:outer membrane protein assembly factor BamA [Desulfobacteraceae bacterium]